MGGEKLEQLGSVGIMGGRRRFLAELAWCAAGYGAGLIDPCCHTNIDDVGKCSFSFLWQ